MIKKKIWYISKYTAPAYAAKNQTRGFLILSKLSSLGHSSLLITSDSNHQAKVPNFVGSSYIEHVDGVEVRWLKTLKFKKSNSFRRILSWFHFEWQLFKINKKKFFEPDIIIVSSLSLFTILNGLILRKRYKCKLIFEVRDIWPLVLTCSGNYSSKNFFIKALSAIEKLAYVKADLIVGTMPNLTEHVQKVTQKDLIAYCIPQVIDPKLLEHPSPLEDEYINLYIPKNKIIFCHAGSIGIDNYLNTFLTSAKKLSYRDDIHFLLLGEGDLKNKYQEECKEFSNITFAPRVEKNQVQSVLNLVDVVYFSVGKSELWNYGQSLNKIIDYMLSKKPILASFSGYPSMINESNCGIYVPAEDEESLTEAIINLADLELSERTAMGERGRNWILKHRNLTTISQEYLTLINTL